MDWFLHDNGLRHERVKIHKIETYIFCFLFFIERRVSSCFFNVRHFRFKIFNPWKISWNWIALSQNSFVISPSLLYHLIRHDSEWLANEVFRPFTFLAVAISIYQSSAMFMLCLILNKNEQLKSSNDFFRKFYAYHQCSSLQSVSVLFLEEFPPPFLANFWKLFPIYTVETNLNLFLLHLWIQRLY